MIDGKTMTFGTMLSAAAYAVLLVGACSPAPGASTAAPKESASEAFSQRGPDVAAAAPAAPAVTTAEPATPTAAADGLAAPAAAVVKPAAPGQVAVMAPPAVTQTSAQTLVPPGWAEVIGRMIGHGLEASDDDLQTVHAYLSRELSPK